MSNIIKAMNAEHCKEQMKSGIVILDFYADWCGPCKILSPILDQISEEYLDKVRVIKVDVDNDELKPLVTAHRVRGIPTLVFLKDGEVAATVNGMTSKQNIIDKFENL
jgi:thioredoxin 1